MIALAVILVITGGIDNASGFMLFYPQLTHNRCYEIMNIIPYDPCVEYRLGAFYWFACVNYRDSFGFIYDQCGLPLL